MTGAGAGAPPRPDPTPFIVRLSRALPLSTREVEQGQVQTFRSSRKVPSDRTHRRWLTARLRSR